MTGKVSWWAHYTLYRTRHEPYAYRLVADKGGYTYHVLWHMESAWGVYVRPEGNVTGMHFFDDEVLVVDALPE